MFIIDFFKYISETLALSVLGLSFLFYDIAVWVISLFTGDQPLTREERDKINISPASTFWAYHEQRYRKKNRIPPIHINCRCDMAPFLSEIKKVQKGVRKAAEAIGRIQPRAFNAMAYGYRAGKTIKAKTDLNLGDILTVNNDGTVDALRHINENLRGLYSPDPFVRALQQNHNKTKENEMKKTGLKLEDLRPEDTGRPFVCDIKKIKNIVGRLNYSHERFYLCQDAIDGIHTHAQAFGFKYAWVRDHNIKNFRFTDTKESQWPEYELVKPFSAQDVMNRHGDKDCTVLWEKIRDCMIWMNTSDFKFQVTDATFSHFLVWFKQQDDEIKDSLIIKGLIRETEEKYKLGGVWEYEEDNEPYIYSACGKWARVFISIEDGDRWDDVWETKRSKFEEEFIEEVNRDGLKYTGFDSIEDYYRDKFTKYGLGYKCTKTI